MPNRPSELVRYLPGGDFGPMIGGVLSAPTVATIDDKNFSLSAQAKNAGGVLHTATETVVVKPLAPILAPLAAAARRRRSRCWGSA